MKIGQTLKLLRTAANFKQTELAKDIGVTANYLSLVENGHREPSLSLLKKFAERLDAPLGYLLWLALGNTESAEATDVRARMDELLSMLVRKTRNESKETKK